MPAGEPTALRVLVTERRWRTYETFKKQFEDTAKALAAETRDQRLADLTVSRTQYERWLRGGLTTRPYAGASAVLERMFSMDVDLLLGPAGEADMPREHGSLLNLKSEIIMAARESSEHAAFAAARSIEETTIEQLQEDIASVAGKYPSVSPVESFGEAKRIRDLALSLLDRTGRPAQESDLYATVGQACAILSVASFDLGYSDAAAEQARSVFLYGRMVGHDSMCAWALGMRALIGNWSNRPLEALELVSKGLAVSPAGTPTARLHAISARAYSHLGNAPATDEAARLALAEADSGAPVDELHDRVGGEFSFDAARIARCLASAYVVLRQPEPVVQLTGRVLELYGGSVPSTTLMPKVEAEARIDLAHAFLIGGQLDAAEDALRPVFALDRTKRVQGITGRLVEIRRGLAAQQYQGSTSALELGARIEVFATESAGAAAPALPQRAP